MDPINNDFPSISISHIYIHSFTLETLNNNAQKSQRRLVFVTNNKIMITSPFQTTLNIQGLISFEDRNVSLHFSRRHVSNLRSHSSNTRDCSGLGICSGLRIAGEAQNSTNRFTFLYIVVLSIVKHDQFTHCYSVYGYVVMLSAQQIDKKILNVARFCKHLQIQINSHIKRNAHTRT